MGNCGGSEGRNVDPGGRGFGRGRGGGRRGMGLGRGWGRGRDWSSGGVETTPAGDDIEDLRAESSRLRSELDAVERRLSGLDKKD